MLVKAPDTLLFLRKQFTVNLVSTETTFTQHCVSTELLYTTLCFYRNYFTQHFVSTETTLHNTFSMWNGLGIKGRYLGRQTDLELKSVKKSSH